MLADSDQGRRRNERHRRKRCDTCRRCRSHFRLFKALWHNEGQWFRHEHLKVRSTLADICLLLTRPLFRATALDESTLTWYWLARRIANDLSAAIGNRNRDQLDPCRRALNPDGRAGKEVGCRRAGDHHRRTHEKCEPCSRTNDKNQFPCRSHENYDTRSRLGGPVDSRTSSVQSYMVEVAVEGVTPSSAPRMSESR